MSKAGDDVLIGLAQRDAAWTFIQFMTAKEQTIYFSQQTGYMPIRQSAIESEEMKAFYKQNPLFQVAVNELAYVRGFPAVKNFEKIEAAIQTALEKTYSQNVPPLCPGRNCWPT